MTISADSGRVDEVLAALANPTRRELLDVLLVEGELPVNELAQRFDMQRPSVSEHLRHLRESGLVAARRRGRERLYRVDAAPLHALGEWLARYEVFWKERLHNLRSVLDEEQD